MIQTWSFDQVRDDLAARFRRDGYTSDAVKMVGLLFARPESRLAREQIVPHLDYYHHRAGTHTHFFCAGYGAYSPPGQMRDAQVVTSIAGQPWAFSARLFDGFRAELERRSRWCYSGGSDLVLTNSVWSAGEQSADLDFSTAVAMNLDQAVADGAIPDVERLFERVFRFGESADGHDPTWGFAAEEGLVAVRSGLVNMLLSLLPRGVGAEAKKLPHFLVADLSAN